jgi:hypothetical protein
LPGRPNEQAAALRSSAGTVADNFTGALAVVFDSVAAGVVGLVTSRHELLARLRESTPAGMPLLTDVTGMILS